MIFSSDALKLDAAQVVDQITATIREQVFRQVKRKGVVLGLSGGIDSSVVAALSVRALGNYRVFGLLMPERESLGESLIMGRRIADCLQITTIVEDITPVLEAARCYQRRDEMIRRLIPQYGEGYKCKIVLPALSEQKEYRIF